MRRILATIVFAVLFGGVGQAQITRHAGSVQIQSTAAAALDVAGGVQVGSGNVALVGTDGKINGPLSTTILDDLSAVNLSGFLGDVTGTGGAMVVGDNSHAHTGTTISALAAGDTTTGTFANARIAVGNVTQHQGSIDHGSIAGLGDDDHTIYGQLGTTETVSAVWTFSAAPDFTANAGTAPDISSVFNTNIVKAWANVENSSSASTALNDDYNVSGVTRTSLGTVRVDFDTNLAITTYAAVATANETVSGNGNTCITDTYLAASVVVKCYNPGNGNLDDSDFVLIVLGDS